MARGLRKARRRIGLVPVALLALGTAGRADRGTSERAREARLVMGTRCEVQVGGLDPAAATAALGQAFQALDRVDHGLSLWKDSELARLNHAGRGRPSGDLMAVLTQALDVAAASAGAFDPTVEPFVRAMGGTGLPPRPLTDQDRRAILRRVGPAHVHLDPARGTVELDPGTTLDLGGNAKGYAADLALAVLRSAGATSGLVDLGGSSIAVFGEPLALRIRDPEHASGRWWGSFEVAEGHVSTSADDQRKDHIVDPRTGRPAHRVLAATVVAGSGIEADALSTAAFVLGADDGLALLQRRGAAGFVLVREQGRRRIRTTSGFAEAQRLRPAPGALVYAEQ